MTPTFFGHHILGIKMHQLTIFIITRKIYQLIKEMKLGK